MKNFTPSRSSIFSVSLPALFALCAFTWLSSFQAYAVNRGFEAGLTGWSALTANGVWSPTTTAGQFRSGSSGISGNVIDTNGSKLLSPTDLAVTIPNNTTTYYVTVIAWVKHNSGSTESGLGVYRQSNGAQLLAPMIKRNTSIFTRESYTVQAVAGETYRVILQSRKDANGGVVSAYFDDVVIYYHTTNVADFISPAKPTTLRATNTGLAIPVTCTLGTDAETAVDGGILLRTPGFVASTPVLSPQVFYSKSSLEGPTTITSNGVTWEVIDNNFLNGSFPTNQLFTGKYTYLAFSRDKGVNYSASARMLGLNNIAGNQAIPASMTVDGLYIPTGTTLEIPLLMTLTLNSLTNISVSGTIINRHDLLQQTNALISFEAGSKYEHASPAASKKIPTATWNTNSTCLVSGVDSYIPLNLDQNYYHFTWNSPSQSAPITPALRNSIFRGNFTVTSTGQGKLTIADLGIKLRANFIQSGGKLAFSGNQATLTFDGSTPQNLIKTGGNMTGLRNVTLNNISGLTLNGALSVNGSLRLEGGAFNLNAGPLTAENGSTIYRSNGSLIGTPSFIGAISVVYLAPVLTGTELPLSATSLRDLTINANGIVTLANPARVNNNLTFIQGKLALQDQGLIVAETGDIIGANPAAYIITNGLGKLTMESLGAAGTSSTVLFPIGSVSGYSPASIRNTATIDNFSIRVLNAVYSSYLPDGTPVGTGIVRNIVNRTWLIEEGVPGGSNVSLTLFWLDSDESESFDRNQSFISHFKNNKWNATSDGTTSTPFVASAVTLNTLFTNGITDFSPFGVGDSDSPLPVELVSFNASLKADNALITWKTANEQNNDYFVIQRSQNGKEWSNIGTVNGAGTSTASQSYNYMDTDFMKQSGTGSYYRLKQVDLDGTSTFGPVAYLTKPKSEVMPASAYFEPASKSVIVDLGNPIDQSAQVQLSSSTGQQLGQQIVAPGQQKLIMNMQNNSSGVYYVTILNGDHSESIRVVAF